MKARGILCLFALTSFAPACTGGCGSGSGSGSAGASASGSASAATPREVAQREAGASRARMRALHHGGFVGLVLRAARETAILTEPQRAAVAEIQDKLHDTEPPLTAIADYQADLAAGVRAGKLDEAKLAGDYAAIDKGLAARRVKQAEAIGELYTALDKSTRAAVVLSAKNRLNAMFRVRPETVDAGLTEAGDPVWMMRRLARVKAEIGVDDAQQPKVLALLSKLGVAPAATEAQKDVIRKHADEMLTAIAGDGLDATKLDLTPTGGRESPLASLQRETGLIAQLLPILTPEQREKLATARQRRALARWTEDTEPWSPVEEALEPSGPR